MNQPPLDLPDFVRTICAGCAQQGRLCRWCVFPGRACWLCLECIAESAWFAALSPSARSHIHADFLAASRGQTRQTVDAVDAWLVRQFGPARWARLEAEAV